jgi:hypothetical protein
MLQYAISRYQEVPLSPVTLFNGTVVSGILTLRMLSTLQFP